MAVAILDGLPNDEAALGDHSAGEVRVSGVVARVEDSDSHAGAVVAELVGDVSAGQGHRRAGGVAALV